MNPVVFVHGYSDQGSSFARWRDVLRSRGREVTTLHVAQYVTLSNEITIKDVAEGLDRALSLRPGLDHDEPFDAVVHSTGMLVVRAWLAWSGDGKVRRRRLKRLVGLAPATFGSPLAHKGRSWLGAVFKGNKSFGQDFLEAGDRILDALELGSRFTWDLAHLDQLADEPVYGPSSSTPFPFIFCGNRGYGGARSLVNEPGTDGTVRWAGCALNTRKFTLDLTGARARLEVRGGRNVDADLVPVDGVNHGSILRDPPPVLVDLVDRALQVDSGPDYAAWKEAAARATRKTLEGLRAWQQFVVRVVDERGDAVPDYNLALLGGKGSVSELREFALDVHAYGADRSLRCFHVDVTRLLDAGIDTLALRIIASSGSTLVGYHGAGVEGAARRGSWEGTVDLSRLAGEARTTLLYPFTTTLLEIRLNREPLPLAGPTDVCRFLDP